MFTITDSIDLRTFADRSDTRDMLLLLENIESKEVLTKFTEKSEPDFTITSFELDDETRSFFFLILRVIAIAGNR